MNRCHRLIFACLSLLVGASPTQAITYCVSTGEQLANALSAAQDNGQTDFIRVRSGVLIFDNGTASYDYSYTSDESLDLSGGWIGAGGACQTQNQQAGQTLIDGEWESGILKLMVEQGSSATVVVRNLGFYRGAAPFNASGSVHIELQTTTTAKVWFSRNSITQSISNGGTAGLYAAANSGELRVIGNLIVGNASEGSNGNGGALIRALYGALVYFNNNTVSSNSRNTIQVGAAGVYFFSMTPMWISNNVITGNTSVPSSPAQFTLDTNASGAQFHLANNHLGVIGFGPQGSPALSELGTLNGDPGFVSANDRRPSAGSILRDSGLNNPPGGTDVLDLIGEARPQGGTIDRGAYEFAIPVLFANGFD